jgi:hypothetical protein
MQPCQKRFLARSSPNHRWEAAEILTEAPGRPIAFAQTPIEQVNEYSKDMAFMLEWFERVGYGGDIAGLEREAAASSRSCLTGHTATRGRMDKDTCGRFAMLGPYLTKGN